MAITGSLSAISSFHLPWYMYDLTNNQLITSKYIPSDIVDAKQVLYTEVPIPGINYQPVVPGGGGNRKLSFTIPLIYKNKTIGNTPILKMFDMLRNRSSLSLLGKRGLSFDSNPKVLYSWGTGSVPLVYWVTKCNMTHKQGWVNQAGAPQYSEVEMELTLDETHWLYKAEELYRAAQALLGIVQGAVG